MSLCSLTHYEFLDDNTISTGFLISANDNSEWLWRIFIWYLIGAFVSTAFISIVSIAFCWLIHGNLSVQHFYHPSKIMWVQKFSGVHKKMINNWNFKQFTIQPKYTLGIFWRDFFMCCQFWKLPNSKQCSTNAIYIDMFLPSSILSNVSIFCGF